MSEPAQYPERCTPTVAFTLDAGDGWARVPPQSRLIQSPVLTTPAWDSWPFAPGRIRGRMSRFTQGAVAGRAASRATERRHDATHEATRHGTARHGTARH